MIRIGNSGELGAVLAVMRESQEAAQWSPEQFAPYFEMAEDANVRRVLLVSEDESSIHGFAAVSAVAGEAELDNFAVAPAFRRRGVGRALLDAVVEWCRERDITVVRLDVRASNSAAIAAYHNYGFRDDGARPAYYANPEEDALLMSLSLSTG